MIKGNQPDIDISQLLEKEASIDVLYRISDIESKEDIIQRGIGRDLICHLVANANAYKNATKDSVRPIDFITFSAHVFELLSINGFLDYIHDHDLESLDAVYDVMVSMRNYTDDMMDAVDAEQTALFFETSKQQKKGVENDIDKMNILIEKFSLEVHRVIKLTHHVLTTNSPSARVKRILEAKRRLDDERER